MTPILVPPSRGADAPEGGTAAAVVAGEGTAVDAAGEARADAPVRAVVEAPLGGAAAVAPAPSDMVERVCVC